MEITVDTCYSGQTPIPANETSYSYNGLDIGYNGLLPVSPLFVGPSCPSIFKL